MMKSSFRLLASCLVWLSAAAGAAADRPPNIVLILADDVGQEVLGCYGGESYPTPHLDRLAETGMRFEHCYSMPVCFPTRLALLTGKYPFRHKDAKWGDFPASENGKTMAQTLSRAGYATAVAGKWQLKLLRDEPDHPEKLGFDHCDVFGWHEGPRYYEPMIYRNGEVREDTLGHYGPDLYVRGLVEFMKRNRERPFFAFYSMALCHDVTDDLEEPVAHGPLGRYDSFPEMVAEMDRAVGRIVAALEALGLRKNTLVLFTTDNGSPRQMIIRAKGKKLIEVPVVSQRGGKIVPGGKGTLTDRGTRVPLIANWPGTIAPKQVVDDLVDTSDFFPTCAELANAKVAEDLDGISFAPRLLRGERSKRHWAFSESKRAHWVRTAKWKLYGNGRMFDMAADSGEENPLREAQDSPSLRTVLGELKAVMGSLK